MSKKNILRHCPFKDQNEGWSSEKEPQIKLSYVLCTHVYVSAGVKVLDVGVEVVLYMCDSGASFLCEYKTPRGSLHKPSTSYKGTVSRDGRGWPFVANDKS